MFIRDGTIGFNIYRSVRLSQQSMELPTNHFKCRIDINLRIIGINGPHIYIVKILVFEYWLMTTIPNAES